MNILRQTRDLRSILDKLKKEPDYCLGFVPTMGALHEGHLSLVKEARKTCSHVLVSIFVNPTQFNDPNDLKNYPRTLASDLEMLLSEKVDVVFVPEASEIYNETFQMQQLELNGLDTQLEGALRPGHFQGVANVVKRFFELIQPHKAFFGQKDFQQTLVIRNLIKNYHLPVELVVVPIAREANGLAMSSRNVRLSETERKRSCFIFKALEQLSRDSASKPLSDALNEARNRLSAEAGATLEYLEAVNTLTLKPVHNLNEAPEVIALTVVQFGGVRLLDNIYLKRSDG